MEIITSGLMIYLIALKAHTKNAILEEKYSPGCLSHTLALLSEQLTTRKDLLGGSALQLRGSTKVLVEDGCY